MAFKVFISYSTRDLQIVQAVRAWLQLPQVEVFISEYAVPPGAPLAPTIKAQIQTCDLFVLLWSENAAASEWVPQEIGIAHGYKKPILPLVLQAGLNLSGFVKELRYIAAFQNTQDAMRQLREYVLTNSLLKKNQQAFLAVLAIGSLIVLLKGE